MNVDVSHAKNVACHNKYDAKHRVETRKNSKRNGKPI